MRNVAVLCLAAMAIAGCRCRPMQVCTDNRVALEGPVTAHVTADLQPRRNIGPLVEMPVIGGSNGVKVALVDVDGLLTNTNMTGPYSAGENPVALFREKLDAIAADRCVCAVVIRLNTPGGGVTASDVMRHELEAFRARTGLPVIAYLMGTATGGGYYLATGAETIVAHPTAITGGIGVILNLYNLQDTMAQFNVLAQPIKSGENIDMGNSLQALSPEARQWLQGMADEFHRRFHKVVIDSRPGVDPAEATTFDGRVFTASQAQQRGLIDGIGYLEDAIRLAEDRIGRSGASVVMFHRENDPARSPFAITANTPPQANWLPVSVPGLERSKLPTFLYIWQLEPTLERLGGQ